MRQVNLKKYVLPNLPYLFVGLYATKLGQAWRLSSGMEFADKVLHLMDGFATAFQSAAPSFHPSDLLVGLCCGAGLRLAVYIKGKNAKKYRHGTEYGSARWGTAKDIQPFVDPVFENNAILTQTEQITMNNRPKDPKTAWNKNFLIIGGSGSGKTRFWLKPNLMQCDSETYPCSFVVTDPKGSIVVECGKMLRRKGYRIKIMNTINFKKSHHYNPFSYIHSEKDILKLVNCLIVNTKGEGGKSGDDFWLKAEMLLYTALIGYIHYEAPEEEQNFSTLLEMINAMEVREDDEEFKNAVDLMFDELKERDPGHFAVRQYAKYKLAAGVVCFRRLLNHLIGKSPKTYTTKKGDNRMDTRMIKQSVTTRQAALVYGISVGRNGMACCPFHDDRHPSMKVDRRFHCFACQADGDVIDFTSRLFGLSSKEAALKLAEDFSISFDRKGHDPPQKRVIKRKISEEMRYRQAEQKCFRVLCDYLRLLERWKEEYAPKQPEDDWNPLFVEALHRQPYIEYLLDLLLSDSIEERAFVVAEYGKEVRKIEQRISEFIASHPAGCDERSRSHSAGTER